MRSEEMILCNKETRDGFASKVETLEKVKGLLLIPQTDLATAQQVADFYEVDYKAITSLVSRNKDELLEDGLTIATGKETKDILVNFNMKITNFRGYFMVDDIKFASRSNLLFNRRAILRVGMLLRDSIIAKEVRTQLLNIEEKTSVEVKTQDIHEEQKLALSLGMAIASGDASATAIAYANMMEFQKRHIIKLEQDNKGLAGEILEWKDRNTLNAGIRKLASVIHEPFGELWTQLYKELQYKSGINLKSRGRKPYIQHIREDEWSTVIKTFCAICEAYEQSPSDMFQKKTPAIQ